MTDQELLREIEAQRNLMVAVATGGPRINEVNDQYTTRRARIAKELRSRRLDDPNPHGDLWAWYGQWSTALEGYASRRVHLSKMYQPLIDQVLASSTGGDQLFNEPTGWPRVDRGIDDVRRNLDQAEIEEHYQTVGLLCREVLISVAQVVYDPQNHPTADGVRPSKTDAGRMLDAYIAKELSGGSNEGVRRHAKAALSLASALQHQRTATYRHAALCAEATTSVVNILAVISGRRDKSP